MSVSTAANPTSSRWAVPACAAVLTLAALAAYHNSFQVPFVFDDISSIVQNPTIRKLGDLRTVLFADPGNGVTVSGRPVLNLSLALCYAISGQDVWSYHVFNLAIHVLAGLTLFGIVRRTLLSAGPLERDAKTLGFVVALGWTLHPLQTEAVTYVIQRAESLMGLFFLLTLYGFIRALGSARPGRWQVLMVLACLGGVGTKEVAALAPPLVLLYDRTFVAGTLREAWRRRRWWHASLAATWVPLALLMAAAGWNRGGTFALTAGASAHAYWLTQFEAVAHYLRLAVWPWPLVFEYGAFLRSWAEVWPFALVVIPLVTATLVALVRWPAAGFLGAWFFAILAPTSLVPGTMQTIVEHRMYLPLAAVVVAIVVGLHAAAQRWPERAAAARLVLLGLGLALALPLGWLTEKRNRDYRDDLTLWRETVARRPDSAKAQSSLGTALLARHQPREALPHYLRALQLDPQRVTTHYDLALNYAALGQTADAIAQLQEALRLNPDYDVAHYQLGLMLLQANRLDDAAAEFAAAVRLNPRMEVAHYEWGIALAQGGRFAEAAEQYRRALELKPDFVEAESDLGTALFRMNRWPEAAARFRRALQLDPNLADAHFNLGLVLARMGSAEEATAHYAEAVRLNPSHAAAQANLGIALARAGRMAEAATHLEALAKLAPASVDAHYNLGLVLLQLARLPEARREFEAAARIDPQFEPARQMLQRLPLAP